jgi:hypothetical protein
MRFVRLSTLAMTAIFTVSTFAITAIPEPVDAAIMCPDIFMPVCAVKHGVRKTYPNSCNAGRVRAHVLHAGECVAPNGNVCFELFMPVCAIDPKTHKRHTYGNLCEAEVADATLVAEGACP